MAVEEAAFQDFVEGGKILVVCRLSSQSGMMTLAKKKEEKSEKKKESRTRFWLLLLFSFYLLILLKESDSCPLRHFFCRFRFRCGFQLGIYLMFIFCQSPMHLILQLATCCTCQQSKQTTFPPLHGLQFLIYLVVKRKVCFFPAFCTRLLAQLPVLLGKK